MLNCPFDQLLYLKSGKGPHAEFSGSAVNIVEVFLGLECAPCLFLPG